jgi:tetratricopeptide (TPR) repeat protein
MHSTWRLAAGLLVAALAISAPAHAIDSALRNQVAEAITDGSPQALDDAEAALRAVPEDNAERWFRLGQVAEERHAIDDAIVAYERSMQVDPSGRYTLRARGRLERLARTRTGDQTTRATFEAVRRDYLSLGRDAARAQVESLIASTDDDAIRAELMAWLASEHLYVTEDLPLARTLFLEAAQTSDDDDVIIAAFHGASLASRTFASLGDTKTVLDAYLATHDRPAVARAMRQVQRDLIDRRGRYPVELVFVLCGSVLLGLFVWLRSWRSFAGTARRRWHPVRRVVFTGWAFFGAGMLAEGYDHGYFEAFLLCIPLVGLTVLIAGAAQVQAMAASRGTWLALQASIVGATVGAVYAGMAAFGKQAVFGL